MNKFNKKVLTALAVVGSTLCAKAEGEGFDIASSGTEIVTALGTAKTQIGLVLGAAILITIAIVVYRKFTGGVSKA